MVVLISGTTRHITSHYLNAKSQYNETQCTHHTTLKHIHAATVAVEKQNILHILSVCFVASAIQHAKRMPSTVLPSVACPALQYFPTLSHKQHDDWKKSY
jgi:hypothetical protein